MNKTGRNDPCPCGSGKKHKQCCQKREGIPSALPPALDTSISATMQSAIALHQAGHLSQAEALYRQILRVAPSHPDALHLLGLIARQRGNNEIAAELISQAIRVNPSNPKYYNNLGNTFRDQDKLDAALECYRRALALKPDYAEAYYNMGNAFKAQYQPDAAIESYRRALALRPDFSAAHSNLGTTLKEQGNLAAAIEHYRITLAINPDSAEMHNNLGIALQAQGDSVAAIEHYRKALGLKPDYAEVHSNLGTALQALGDLDMAIEHYRAALALRPDYAEAHGNLGNAFRNQNRPETAVECYRKALALKPDDAQIHHNLSLTLLLHGKFHEGWREYEWRIKCQSGNAYITAPHDPSQVLPRPSALLPVNLDGKRLLFVPDQGIGDELFFLRFAPAIQRQGAWTAYLPSPKIATIVQRAPGLNLVASSEDIPADLDHIFSVGDLPLILDMDASDDIPPALPLTALPERVATMRNRLADLGETPLLGVTWRAGTQRGADGRLSLCKETDISLLGSALSAWPGEVLILQRNPRPEEIAQFTRALGRPAHDLSDLNENLEEMLALLSLLDEYVGVSNTNLHLRAGLGKNARVLIPHPPEWRWLMEGDESPWFPGFQLYRETADGDWAGVFARLPEELHRKSTPYP